MKKRIIVFSFASALFLLLIFRSDAAKDGAACGLVLWTEILVPSLLPFFTAAGLLSRLGVTDALGRRIAPAGQRLLGLSGAACSVFLLGLSGGYPLGAASAADAVRSGRMDRQEAERLLRFCDNTGPAFAAGALGAGVFHSAAWGLLLWGVHVLSALILAAVFRPGPGSPGPAPAAAKPGGAADALTGSVAAACSALISIGGYVIFFSALLKVSEGFGFPGAAADALSGFTGSDPTVFRALLTGTLELSSGIGAMRGLPLTPASLALGAFLLSFGGICVHLQAAAVTAGTGIKLTGRLKGKLLQGVLSAGITFFISYWILQ